MQRFCKQCGIEVGKGKSFCNDCYKTRKAKADKNWALKNKNYLKEKLKKDYLIRKTNKDFKEKRKLSNRKRYLKEKDKINKQATIWRINNKEKAKLAVKKYASKMSDAFIKRALKEIGINDPSFEMIELKRQQLNLLHKIKQYEKKQ